MAEAIQLSVKGINQQTVDFDVVVPTFGVRAYDETNDLFPDAVTKVVVPRPSTAGSSDNYWVTQTLTEVLEALNETTVTDLTVVDDITINDDIHFTKEADHTIDVNTSTTAATAGGAISIVGGIGATSGAGGAINITGGVAGATAASVGGAVNITSGTSGAGNGASGAVNLKTGVATAANTGALAIATGAPATSGNSGALSVFTGVAATGDSGALTAGSGAVTTGNSGGVTISTGNSGTGNSGSITLSPGTASAVVGKIVMSNAVVEKHKTAAINSTATATAKEVATGYITSTSGAATTITLPTGTLLGGELGAARGTVFELYIDNTLGSNTVTIAVATDGILSALAAAESATFGLLTVPSGATGTARFTLVFSSATTYTFSRTA